MNLDNVGAVLSRKECMKGTLALQESLSIDCEYSGVITFQKFQSGDYHALSYYPDSIWYLNPNDFPVTVPASRRLIDFTKIPDRFVRAAKRYVALEIQKNRVNTVVCNYGELIPFLNYLDSINLCELSDITPLVSMQYVTLEKSRRAEKGKNRGRPMSASVLTSRFLAVERLHYAMKCTSQKFLHPWPETSASHLAANNRFGSKKPKTEVIPEEAFVAAFQFANEYLERAEVLLKLFELISEVRDKNAESSSFHIRKQIIESLLENSYLDTPRHFNREIDLLETSCWLIILATTGIRIHELGGLKSNGYHHVDEDGERYWFLESKSLKTGEGETSWLCPEIAILALKVMSRLTERLRLKLSERIDVAENSGERSVAEKLSQNQHSCMLVTVMRHNNDVGVLSDVAINRRLNKLATAAGIDWHFTSHQFRRTFAHFVVHNQLGDLRYLRDHFKHWSLDMTALYAWDDDLEMELFSELNFIYKEKGQDLFEHWMDGSTPLAGGLKDRVLALRHKDDAVQTYGSRQSMIQTICETISVRSTGIAWCTNDTFGCGGGQCEECDHSIIDDTHVAYWEAMYIQQLELRNIKDELGPSGTVTIERTILRCEHVLAELGADVSRIKERTSDSA